MATVNRWAPVVSTSSGPGNNLSTTASGASANSAAGNINPWMSAFTAAASGPAGDPLGAPPPAVTPTSSVPNWLEIYNNLPQTGAAPASGAGLPDFSNGFPSGDFVMPWEDVQGSGDDIFAAFSPQGVFLPDEAMISSGNFSTYGSAGFRSGTLMDLPSLPPNAQETFSQAQLWLFDNGQTASGGLLDLAELDATSNNFGPNSNAEHSSYGEYLWDNYGGQIPEDALEAIG